MTAMNGSARSRQGLPRRTFLGRSAAAMAAVGWGSVALGARVKSPETISIASEPQLFLDDWIIERQSGFTRKLHQPAKQGLIKEADGSDWERGDCYAAEGNTVARDNSGKFHMTYRYLWWDARIKEKVGEDRAHWFNQVVGYAHSTDGIHWHKPTLGRIEGPAGFDKTDDFPFETPRGLTTDNNLGSPIDFITDLHALGNISDPDKRFLLRVAKKDGTAPFAKLVESAMYFAPDWPDFANDAAWREKLTPIPNATLSPRGFKTVCGYDHQAREWFQVCQDRISNWAPRGGRDIARFWTKDLVNWEGPQLALPVADDESRATTDWIEYMFLNAHRAGGMKSGAWLGQLEIFHSDRSSSQYEVPFPGVWRKGTLEQRLVISRDAGRSWQRVGDKEVWLPHHEDPHGYDRLAFGALPVRVGDEVWYYYSCWDGEHLIFNKDGSLFEPGFIRRGRTARATLRLDGHISLDAGPDGGEVVSRPLVFEGKQLIVNAHAPQGEIKVELQDESGQSLPGFGLSECLGVRGDGVALGVGWRDSPDVGKLAGKPVRVRLVAKDAAVYSFTFVK